MGSRGFAAISSSNFTFSLEKSSRRSVRNWGCGFNSRGPASDPSATFCQYGHSQEQIIEIEIEIIPPVVTLPIPLLADLFLAAFCFCFLSPMATFLTPSTTESTAFWAFSIVAINLGCYCARTFHGRWDTCTFVDILSPVVSQNPNIRARALSCSPSSESSLAGQSLVRSFQSFKNISPKFSDSGIIHSPTKPTPQHDHVFSRSPKRSRNRRKLWRNRR